MFSYIPNLVSDKDRVRFIVQDTENSGHLFEDEEINYLLSKTGSSDLAAIACARIAAAKYSRLADTTIETVSVSHSQKAKAFLALAKDLQTQYDQSASGMAGMSSTGIGISETDSVYQDPDRLIDETIQGMFKNPQFSNRYGYPYNRYGGY